MSIIVIQFQNQQEQKRLQQQWDEEKQKMQSEHQEEIESITLSNNNNNQTVQESLQKEVWVLLPGFFRNFFCSMIEFYIEKCSNPIYFLPDYHSFEVSAYCIMKLSLLDFIIVLLLFSLEKRTSESQKPAGRCKTSTGNWETSAWN